MDPARLDPSNLAFVEELYYAFLKDPSAVPEEWRAVFRDMPPTPLPPAAFPHSIFAPRNGVAAQGAPLTAQVRQDAVRRLIESYRERGHLYATLDPLGLDKRGPPASLVTLEANGLSEADLDKVVSTGDVAGPQEMRLRDLVALLRETYCRTIGVEVAHIHSAQIRGRLQEKMESSRNHPRLSRDQQRRLFQKLTDAEIFEQFLHAKFVGAKRFSLEGAESLIPLVDLLIERAGMKGVEEVVIGMAHRGRLNVLVNVLGKGAAQVFAEFEDSEVSLGSRKGDVKYHLGHSADRVLDDGRKVHLSLSFNPSHLEWVDPVVQGRVRAKQDRRGDIKRANGLPLLIHGDAAFAGQGILAECLNMSELEGYGVGGTIHVVVNNQIGFTTNPEDSRSSTYCTSVARMLQIPIFHVNGEDPEAVAQVVDLAMDYRQTVHKDVVIDLWCYRKYGHNEGDEPAFTQPVMYAAIAKKPSIREVYAQRLEAMGQITREEADRIAAQRREALEAELAVARELRILPTYSAMAGLWSRYKGGADAGVPQVPTAVPLTTLRAVSDRITAVPAEFLPHPKIKKLLELRAAMGRGEKALDWGMGEALAFGSLLWEGARVRLSGQDARRGTFSHRHSVLFDFRDGRPYAPLANLREGQGVFETLDSPLSEAGVLGFDFGYSLDYPDALVIWEAQFGDFVNAAQVIIDQFLSAAEEKWNRISGLVLLLPHGYEGQGPEHSSARPERILGLCADDNMQVVNLTTPAQLFHALRRQVLRPLRKPLVVLSPKSLLRHKLATSSLDELANGSFQKVIPDALADPARVRRILLCNGKVYYDLFAAREERKMDHVALVRLEQLYPLDKQALHEALSRYSPDAPLVWVQEEPRNMGAWRFLWDERLGWKTPPSCVSRPISASPATGSHTRHDLEQGELIDKALGGA